MKIKIIIGETEKEVRCKYPSSKMTTKGLKLLMSVGDSEEEIKVTMEYLEFLDSLIEKYTEGLTSEDFEVITDKEKQPLTEFYGKCVFDKIDFFKSSLSQANSVLKDTQE